MSLFKRIWIEKDPHYAEFRKSVIGDPEKIIPQYPYGAPLRHRNRLASPLHFLDSAFSLGIAISPNMSAVMTIDSKFRKTTQKG